jgi:cell division protein FtsI/penicillin-binding protein 2
MGAEQFYSYYQRFGFGQTTGIDLMGESPGTMLMPGHPLWTPVDIATNSFGQGMAVTPLQMISAVSAIANQGDQMLPHVVAEFHSADGVVYREPEIISTPIEPRTADQVTTMAIQSVSAGAVPGYTVAGKTGTAQIVEGGVYHPTDTIASYIGWLPADDPQLIMLVKLDRPQESPWGSRTAAPTFAKLASELVVLLDIPPDEIRLGTTSVQASNN